MNRAMPYIIPLALGLLFVFISLRVPSDTSLQIRMPIILLEILIWTIASVSAFRFKRYASGIKEHEDGKGLNHIANALLLLVLYIILLTTAGTTVKLFADTPLLDAAVFLRRHLPPAVLLASVASLLIGSQHLVKIVGKDIWTRKRLAVLILSALLFFAAFGWTFYEAQPNRIVIDGIPRFVLPVGVLLFTYVLPHVLVWFAGFKACINLAYFAAKAPGLIYKSLFKDLYRGILLIFFCIFSAQFIIATSLTATNVKSSLAIVYPLILICIIGFALVNRGSKKLSKLETDVGDTHSSLKI